ncbi:hypothetical protein GUJ93_ZPchr0007g3217 [Zizania palustris]|uniref:Uncharacterized protein n=1 Tax=Zizania palustris TaxID=103762 RepID=A0A8J5STC6_ZIZPA|nr:hypothetical protein GUJ93_ZPchr0007g3217 [Zizania palustris]
MRQQRTSSPNFYLSFFCFLYLPFSGHPLATRSDSWRLPLAGATDLQPSQDTLKKLVYQHKNKVAVLVTEKDYDHDLDALKALRRWMQRR